MKVKIREGKDKDYKDIEKINRLTGFSTLTEKKIKARIFSHKNPYFIVAVLDGRVVGYEMGYDVKGKLYNCYKAVHPERQRKRIGQKLLDRQTQIAKQKGYKYIFIKSPNTSVGMLILALKNNYKIIGYKDREWGYKPAVWLERKI